MKHKGPLVTLVAVMVGLIGFVLLNAVVAGR